MFRKPWDVWCPGRNEIYQGITTGRAVRCAEESEVLFTLIAKRYKRRSLGINSNLVFSEWEKTFANSVTTTAVIDRIVYHSVILELDLPSYRNDPVQNRQAE